MNCSFCGKSIDEVDQLITGPGVYICSECVDFCTMIRDEFKITANADEISVARFFEYWGSD